MVVRLFLLLLPKAFIRYWPVQLIVALPFVGLALYHHSFQPYIWWWLPVAMVSAAAITTIAVMREGFH
jgi:hypothetical protein